VRDLKTTAAWWIPAAWLLRVAGVLVKIREAVVRAFGLTACSGQQGLVRCGTSSIGSASGGDGRTVIWLATDHGS
jgi:hypothetical protein